MRMHLMARRSALLLVLLAVVSSACGGGAAPEPGATRAATGAAGDATATGATATGATATGATATGATTEEAFRVAVVAPSAENDLAFSQSIYDALQRVGEERPLDLAFSGNLFVVEDAAAALRDYAAQGYDLVIGHGSQYGGIIQELAPEFPETAFAWGTAADTFGLDNVFAYEAASDEGGYAMGVMAATMTESGRIGVIGPVEVGDAKLYVDGFVAGAEATDSAVETTVNYTGSFSDVALASEAAQAFISDGADVLTGTAQMVVGAVGVAAEAGVPWFGTQSNQTQLAPSIVVASQVYHWEGVLNDMIDQIEGGTLGGEIYEINLANGGLVIEFNDQFDLAEDVRAAGEEAIAGLEDGSIETGATA